MAEPSQTTGNPPKPAAGSSLTIPADVAAKFGPLLELIKKSESMNDEERQYWINILPIMTPDQIKNLQDILDNERKQLQAIDEKYAQQMQKTQQQSTVAETDAERRKRRQSRQAAETTNKQQEDEHAQTVLQEIEKAL